MMQGHGMMGGMMGGMGMMGNMGPVPNLGGQRAAYILVQLDAFAKGTRRATVMRAIASSLSEKDRKAVAEYLSGVR
jgi:cytochrome c553